MYLERIEIFGFKSFAHKTVLELSPNITCIVGPNGSGKSNILDAIRWVTGEQSLKVLRGKKSEDIIFSGSIKKTRSNLSEVSLYFNNEDKSANTEYAHLVITRRLFRNGDSEYSINQQKARLQDVLLLLAQVSLAQKSYSIISQGMTDHLLTCSMKERKDFFDEAAKVKHYQIKLEQSLHKLEITAENLRQGQMMLEEITPHLRSLSRQVGRLKRREEIETELRQMQRKYFSALWQEIEKQRQKENKELEQAQKGFTGQKNKLDSLKQKLAQIVGNDLQDNVLIGLQKKYEEVLRQKNDFLSKEAVLRAKIEIEQNRLQQIAEQENDFVPQTTVRKMIETLKEVNAHHEDLMQKIESAKTSEEFLQIKNLARRIKEKLLAILSFFKKEKEPEVSPRQLEDFLKEQNNLEKRIKDLEEQLRQAERKMNEHNRAELGKRKEMFDLQIQFQTEQKQMDLVNNQLNEIRIALSRLDAKKEDLEAEIEQEIKGFEPKLEKVINEIFDREQLRSEINQTKSKLEMIGGIDPEIEKEYEQTKTRSDFITSQTHDLRESIISLKKLCKDLEQTIKEKTEIALEQINVKFNEYFKILFAGGKAQLILQKAIEQKPLEDENEVKTEIENKLELKEEKVITGLEIKTTLPGKKISDINTLSGGERALTALALICAIISYNPPPFIILDEADAALDEANSHRFSSILEGLTHQAQFILITHNRITMEKGKILYGVTMADEGISKILSVNLEQAKEVVAE